MKLVLLHFAALTGAFIYPNEQVSHLSQVKVESSKAKDTLQSACQLLRHTNGRLDAIWDKATHGFRRFVPEGMSSVQEDTAKEVTSKLNEYFDKSRAYFEHITNQVADRSGQVLEEAHETVTHDLAEKYQEFVAQSENTLEDLSDQVADGYHESVEKFQELLDAANGFAEDATSEVKAGVEDVYNGAQDWAESSLEELDHHHHHHKPNQTLYQLIVNWPYSKKFAELINEHNDLVETLNGTAANYTVFVPDDDAFKDMSKHDKPPKEELKEILSYHISPEFFPAGRILLARTIPTLYHSKSLGKEPLPQRLSTRFSLFHGLTVNYYAKVTAVDIFGTNGVIHGVNNLIVPPPRGAEIIQALPGDLSTLELGLHKTDLFKLIDSKDHKGGTLFAPTNSAFSKLGRGVNGFLFSEHGLKYLEALLKYHIVPDKTLYSDAYYKASSGEDTTDIPKGTFHVDLRTLLKGHSLSIDIARFARLIEIKINSFYRVGESDIVAEDGVIQFVDDVLIPPRQLDNGELEEWKGGELSVEELKERLAAHVEQHDPREEEL